ncbi:MAG: hypothetical protein NXI32_18280 [bacterium]|nr:hypothetical protein [bacterium]
MPHQGQHFLTQCVIIRALAVNQALPFFEGSQLNGFQEYQFGVLEGFGHGSVVVDQTGVLAVHCGTCTDNHASSA